MFFVVFFLTAMKIHISQESRNILAQNGEFLIEKRGTVDVKVLWTEHSLQSAFYFIKITCKSQLAFNFNLYRTVIGPTGIMSVRQRVR